MYKLADIESKFADIIWSNEPISSGELVKQSIEELNWKKSTTYTVLKKLCEKGIFQNNNSVVTSIMTKQEYIEAQSRVFVEERFDNSLPKFITAFMGNKRMTETEIAELQKIIDSYKDD